jgi:hypothetical protein
VRVIEQPSAQALPSRAGRPPLAWIGGIWLLALLLLIAAVIATGRAASSRDFGHRANTLETKLGSSLDDLQMMEARITNKEVQLEETHQRIIDVRRRLDRGDVKLHRLRHDIRVERRRIAAEAAAAAAAAAAASVPSPAPLPIAPPPHIDFGDHCQLGCD